MDKPSSKLFAEALQLLDSYYRSVVTQVAEEIVANRKKFEAGGGGRAAKIVDEHGQHLQNLNRIQSDLMNMINIASAPPPGEGPGSAVAPSGRFIGADTPLEAGAAILVEWGGTWWRAKVLDCEPNGAVHVHYLGWADTWDETVPRSRIQEDTGTGPAEMVAPRQSVAPSGRPIGPDFELAPGMPILVEWGGTWWPATVLRADPDGGVRIHYTGWGNDWDETVPRSRIQEDPASISGK